MTIEILNQNCYEHIKTIADSSVNLIITDPPYLMENTLIGGRNKIGHSAINTFDNIHKNREVLAEGFNIDFMFKEFKRIQPFLNIYIFANKNLLGQILSYCVAQGIKNYDILIYHKTNPAPAFRYHYLNDLEYIFYLCDNKGLGLYNNFESSSKLYQANINYERFTKHPTEKPLALIERLMRNSSKEADLVYDPFLGSGTTAHCAKMLNRNFIGTEIMTDFYNQAVKRLQSVQGILF